MPSEDRRAKQAPLTATAWFHNADTGNRPGQSPLSDLYFFPFAGGDFFSPAKPFCAILASVDLG